MKRPSFQFYPADWSANSNLRRCTHEEKGIWIDVMCLLHDQEEYGVARWPLKEIAQAVGAPVTKIKSLVSKGVLKGADAGQQCEALVFTPTGAGRKKGTPVTLVPTQDGPVWFSSRMVEDEYKRVIRGEYGNTPKTTPDSALKPPIGAAPKTTPDPAPSRAGASSSSSSSPSVNPSTQPPSPTQPESEPENFGVVAGDLAALPDTPTSEGQWLTWFNREVGTQFDASSRFDRSDLWPIFSRWCQAGITQQQMRTAIRTAQETASAPIANLPKYVDRVLANSQAPQRTSHSDQSKLAASRAIFGTEIEGEQHAQSHRIIDVTPTVAEIESR